MRDENSVEVTVAYALGELASPLQHIADLKVTDEFVCYSGGFEASRDRLLADQVILESVVFPNFYHKAI